MNRPFGGLSNGPLCEPGRLIVQVIGKHHRRQQKVMLRSANGESLWAYPVPLTKTFCSSVLHTWDDVLPGDRLCLEIESTEGEPIRLPLLDTLCLTPRQLETQWNQLVPVLQRRPPATPGTGRRLA